MAVFKTRKAVLAILTIVVNLVLPLVPALAPSAGQIGLLATVIAGVAILGITVEDSAKAWADRPVTTRVAIEDVVDVVLDAVFGGDDAETPPSTETSTTA